MSLLSRYFRKILLVVVTLLTLLLPACLLKSKETDVVTAPPPTISGGKIIATYDNARPRCGFEATSEEDRFQVVCHIVALQADGNEAMATKIEEGVTLSWPRVSNSDTTYTSYGNCADQELTCQREVTVANIGKGATVDIELLANMDSKLSLSKWDSVFLPFGVTTFGSTLQAPNIESLPAASASQILSDEPGLSASRAAISFGKKSGIVPETNDAGRIEKLLRGFQSVQKDEDKIPLPNHTSKCMVVKPEKKGDQVITTRNLFFSAGHFIYRVDLNKSKSNLFLFAGSHNRNRLDNLTNPLVACSDDGVFISDNALDARPARILRIGDSGDKREMSLPTVQAILAIGVTSEGKLLIRARDFDMVERVQKYTSMDTDSREEVSSFNPIERPLTADGDSFALEGGKITKTDSSGAKSTLAGAESYFTNPTNCSSQPQLNSSKGVAIDSEGAFIFSDTENNKVKRFNPKTCEVSLVAGTGEAGSGGDGGSPSAAQLNGPQGVVILPDNSLLIADTQNNRIRHVQGNIISSIPISGMMVQPKAIALNPNGGREVFVTSSNRVWRAVLPVVLPDPTFLGFRALTTTTSISPSGVAINAAGKVFIVDANVKAVFSLEGSVVGTLTPRKWTLMGDSNFLESVGTWRPSRLRFIGSDLLVTDMYEAKVFRLSPNGLPFRFDAGKYFGFSSNQCGSRVEKQATAANLEKELQISLDSVCAGSIFDIAVRNHCNEEAEERFTEILFAQTFGDPVDPKAPGSSSFVRIKRPCVN